MTDMLHRHLTCDGSGTGVDNGRIKIDHQIASDQFSIVRFRRSANQPLILLFGHAIRVAGHLLDSFAIEHDDLISAAID
jgi:hypothetical protein